MHEGLMSFIHGVTATQQLSIYADDAALFIKPTTYDLSFVRAALDIFDEASRLRMNCRKTWAVLIRGSDIDRNQVAGMLQCQIDEFPCRYLGIQLAISPLTRVECHPLLDQVHNFLPAWQRGLIQGSGASFWSVIAARPIHKLMILEAPQWVFEDINSWIRSFFWAGKE
ncbi:Serine/threonine-protein kinase CTR1 [Hordeum vulgare]|nr:Serine/threonine-protein kinase CTR1 [Hordeum vulgare]